VGENSDDHSLARAAPVRFPRDAMVDMFRPRPKHTLYVGDAGAVYCEELWYTFGCDVWGGIRLAATCGTEFYLPGFKREFGFKRKYPFSFFFLGTWNGSGLYLSLPGICLHTKTWALVFPLQVRYDQKILITTEKGYFVPNPWWWAPQEWT
jgi:hypothetical protein